MMSSSPRDPHSPARPTPPLAPIETTVTSLREEQRIVADAVNVYLCRDARRGYHGDAPVRRVIATDTAEPRDEAYDVR